MTLFLGIGEDADLCDMVEMFHSRSEEGRTPPKGPPAPIRRLIAKKARLQERYGDLPKKEAPSKPLHLVLDERLLEIGAAGIKEYEMTPWNADPRPVGYGAKMRRPADAGLVAGRRLRAYRLLSGEICPGAKIVEDSDRAAKDAGILDRRLFLYEQALADGYLPYAEIEAEYDRRRGVEAAEKELRETKRRHDKFGCPVANFEEWVEARWQKLSEKSKAEQTREGFTRQFADAAPTCRLCEGGE